MDPSFRVNATLRPESSAGYATGSRIPASAGMTCRECFSGLLFGKNFCHVQLSTIRF
jgi:hypothetical protein